MQSSGDIMNENNNTTICITQTTGDLYQPMAKERCLIEKCLQMIVDAMACNVWRRSQRKPVMIPSISLLISTNKCYRNQHRNYCRHYNQHSHRD